MRKAKECKCDSRKTLTFNARFFCVACSCWTSIAKLDIQAIKNA